MQTIPNDSIAIAGAKAGRQYGEANKNNKEALAKINDSDWLKECTMTIPFNKIVKFGQSTMLEKDLFNVAGY